MKRVAGLVSLLLHAVAGVAVAGAHARPVPPAPQVKVQVAVVEKPPPPPPPPAVVTPPPVVHVVRMARAAGRSLPPRQLDAPPPRPGGARRRPPRGGGPRAGRSRWPSRESPTRARRLPEASRRRSGTPWRPRLIASRAIPPRLRPHRPATHPRP